MVYPMSSLDYHDTPYELIPGILERKIWNPLVYVADMLKKLSGSEQFYLVNVKILLM